MRKIILESIQKLDFAVWGLTLLFFIGSAFLLGGDINNSFSGASGIIVLMFLVGFSIELILASLKNVKGLGKITGFITNGPEALVLIVGLINNDVLFAASTPLGSNVMNPVLLIVALLTTGYILKLKKVKHKTFFILSYILTAILAISFFQIPTNYYIIWIAISLIISLLLFFKKIENNEHEKEDESKVASYFLPLGVIILLVAGYFLDPVVSFTADASQAPKGVIGFLVLATLTSWPEFKSILGLFKRNKIIDGFENILVSNITNIWLAIIGVMIWLIMK